MSGQPGMLDHVEVPTRRQALDHGTERDLNLDIKTPPQNCASGVEGLPQSCMRTSTSIPYPYLRAILGQAAYGARRTRHG